MIDCFASLLSRFHQFLPLIPCWAEGMILYIIMSAEVTPDGGLVREYEPSALNSGLGIIGICRILLYTYIYIYHYIHTLTVTRAASGLHIPYNQINQAKFVREECPNRLRPLQHRKMCRGTT